ncbi:CoA-substrate-specific enzyme activase [Thermanaerovibrio acidaminovorans DSM 6589]|uniref:CoA-substrate-specific enzyme activase n=1 Tax=Thermanaerovibrio acidaminovorans (strain ATCC 49978 / DSM 6589 / Su883) TaxID=525903 RepID=D1B888_THEAS|nr:acyl-CoA dehydratase activase [Thermanaerovibrio acidaminovorans]ACZ18491.1 CoA-substrate-specific enzyme activase [Thermanaerovibrio acidaminovorans DSM 6589]
MILGIDAGSRFIKWALMDRHRVADLGRISSEGADLTGLPKLLPRASSAGVTGYGRHLLREVFPACRVLSEISAHALGARHLKGDTTLVLDVGGQDSKAIEMDRSGRVLDFRVNDRCAAGTGRFLENMGRVLGIGVQDMIQEAIRAQRSAPVSSMCAVFAESEVISLLSKGTPRGEVARGIFESLRGRLEALASCLSKGDFAFTGGLSEVSGAGEALSSRSVRLIPLPNGAYAGAIGAALAAMGN